MANVYAVKSGNWSDTTVWNTGALPTSTDDVYANGYTVTIDTSPTVLSIRTTSASGISSGGQIRFTDGITVTCTGAGLCQNSFNNDEIAFTLNSPAVVNYVGNLTAISYSCLVFIGSGTFNITGNVSVTSGANAIVARSLAANGGVLNITGSVDSGGASQGAIRTNNYGVNVNVVGNVTAGVTKPAIVELTSVLATVSITGTVTPQDDINALFVTSYNPTIYLSGPLLCSTNGTHAVCAPKWRWTTATPTNTYYQVRNNTLSDIRPLYTADSVGGNPATNNVRSGTVYGPSSELTGTCAVPAAGSVLLGVPVDNTTGTVTIAAADIRSAVGLASANLDTQLSRLANAATTQEVADIVEGAVSA